MGGRVGGVHELSGNEAAGNLLGQLAGLGDGALHAPGPFGEDQLRAVGLHQLAALHAHGFGHDNDNAVAPGGGHGGQADAGVAGGGFDDDGAGFQKAPGLGVVEHGLGDPVLDGPGGVEIFQLRQDPGLQPLFLLDMDQLQQGRFADQLIGGCVYLAHSGFLLIISILIIMRRLSRSVSYDGYDIEIQDVDRLYPNLPSGFICIIEGKSFPVNRHCVKSCLKPN